MYPAFRIESCSKAEEPEFKSRIYLNDINELEMLKDELINNYSKCLLLLRDAMINRKSFYGKHMRSYLNNPDMFSVSDEKDDSSLSTSNADTFKKVLGIDFETANQYRDSACSVGLYLKDFSTNNILYQEEHLINPECEFNHFNTLVHGITEEKVQNSPTFPKVYSIINSLLDKDTIVIAHNAAFDVSVLRRSCERYNLKKPSFTYLCTLLMSRAIIKGLPSYSLNVLAENLNIGNFIHHNSLEDARICVLLFEKLVLQCECFSINQLIEKSIISCGKVDGEADSYFSCQSLSSNSTKRINNLSNDPQQSISDDTKETFIDPNHELYGKTVVFTGALNSMTREIAIQSVKSVGGIVGNSVTKSTNYLVYGYQNKSFLGGKDKSSKLLKAESYIEKGYDLQIMNENDFIQLL